jgi:hypothetical protein
MGRINSTNKTQIMKTILTMILITANSNLRSRKLNEAVLLLLLTVSLLTSNLANAQTNSNKPEIGFKISQYQKDFGIGLHVISPYFMKKSMAIKAGTNIQWFENSNDTETTWTTYQNIQLGMRGRSHMVTENISIYGEGGAFFVLPDSDFSTQSLEFGGYGLFGFEFRICPRFGYFIELGGVGTSATADKIASQPIYSNGFFTNVGLKIGF